jgi:uncharacterized membrane protein
VSLPDPLVETLALLACVGAGIIGGVFFAFSTFVMKALDELPAGQAVAAMQRINVVVLNPTFLGVIVGTGVLGLSGVGAAFLPWRATRSPLLIAGGIVYLVGCLFVTLAFNVPRNERLAVMNADSAEAMAYWPVYMREWCWWNHVRAAASIVAAALEAATLVW